MRLAHVLLACMFVGDTALAQEPAVSDAGKRRVDEVIVVTASRSETSVREAPAAVTVITAEELGRTPAAGYGDILRNVPGLNVTQMNAREMQVTARAATSSLATSQLVLLDGRSLYLDFFGFVMWDFLPIDVSEIRQIEVVRGPGSAVWGANAMNGVINLITKRPREMDALSVTLGAGENGTRLGSVTHVRARDRWSYKLSASFYGQDALERPSGVIPGTRTPYPAFANEGTSQPKCDLRLDYDTSPTSFASLSAGYAGTDGLVHSGIGPFDLESGSSMKYAKADWTRGDLRVTAFANFLDADSTNLLARGVDGRPIAFSFKTNTYDLDSSRSSAVRDRHLLTYGLTARLSEFDLSIAPAGRSRKEYGAFLQDEVVLGRVQATAGVRLDHRNPIGTVVSPRAALLYSPTATQTVRFSFSRAYRAPSLINSDLDTAILSLVTLPTGPFAFATRAVGNRELGEERMDAVELGYVGSFPGNVSVAASIYRNNSRDFIDFYPSSFYSGSNPPAGWPLPPQFLDAPPLRNALPSSFSYRNVGQIINQGVELGVNARPSPAWSWFANYTFQADPRVKGIPSEEINVSPAHRANLGASWDRERFFLNASANYQDEAIWRDVLDGRYWGPTESFTTWNAAAGLRLNKNITLSLSGTNLTDARVQQHVFGDIIARKLVAQVRYVYP